VCLYLVELQPLLGVWHENLADEGEGERVKLAPRRHGGIAVVLPGDVLAAADRWLVPGEFWGKGKKGLS
jgi:hypothetical protein